MQARARHAANKGCLIGDMGYDALKLRQDKQRNLIERMCNRL
jgi:hypothetical protein